MSLTRTRLSIGGLAAVAMATWATIVPIVALDGWTSKAWWPGIAIMAVTAVSTMVAAWAWISSRWTLAVLALIPWLLSPWLFPFLPGVSTLLGAAMIWAALRHVRQAV